MNDSLSPPNGVPPVLGPTPAGRSPSRRPGWSIHLLLLAAYPLAVGLLGETAARKQQPALTHGVSGLLLVCALNLLVFGAVFGLAWLASRASRDDLLLRWRNGFWTVPLGLGYSVALRLALLFLAAIVSLLLLLSHLATPEALAQFFQANRPEVETLVDVSAMRRDPLYYWLTLTLVSFVVAGLREELWRAGMLAGLRHLWPERFGSRAGQCLAVALAAIIFGLGHLPQGPLAVCLTGLLGVGLGLIMVLHRSIWPAVLAHGMFDATSLALLPWAADRMHSFQ